MTRIVLGDDHAMIRGGVAQLIREAGDDLNVVAQAQDYPSIMKALREHEPNVLVLDIDMPGKNGIEILKIARKEFPRLAVLLYSMHSENEYGVRALKAGASGYVTKSAPAEELTSAIRAVAQGRKWINPALAAALAEHVNEDPDRPPHETLSDREFQTLRLIASGKRLSDIAEALSLSPKTVSVYRARLLEKMRLKNNAELTHYAMKNGLVD